MNLSSISLFKKGFPVLALALGSFCLPAIASEPDVLDGGPVIPVNLIRLKIVGGVGADETIVYFDEQATDGYDPVLDATKLLSDYPGVPNIYSKAGEEDVSINVMGGFNADKIVPLTLNISKNGPYVITVEELKYIEPTTVVYLEDRLNNTFYNLRMQTTLNFNFTVANIAGRFFLHYYLPVEFTTTGETCRQNDGVIRFNNPSSNPWDVILLSDDGLTQLATAQAVVGEHLFVGLDGADYNLSVQKSDGYSQMIPASVSSAMAIDPSFSSPAEPVKAGTPVQFTANQTGTGLTYSWDMGDGTLLSDSSFVEHIYTAPGVYTVTLLISDGSCSNASQFSMVVLPDVVTGICAPVEENTDMFEVFPNPAKDILSIRVSADRDNQIEWIHITDMQGRVLRSELVAGLLNASQQISLAVDYLAAGTYFMIATGKDKKSARMFVIRH